MIKGKIKNIESNKTYYDIEFDIEVIENLKRVYLKNINNYPDFFINFMFYHTKGNLYIEEYNENRISLINLTRWSEKDRICIKCQCLYIGNKFIKDISDINEIKVTFGYNLINEADKKIKEILKDKVSFNTDNVYITIDNNIMLMKGKRLKLINENKLFYSIYELLWIIYGFFPKIKNIEYKSNADSITEYLTLVYVYNSSKEHCLKINKLVDIQKVNNFKDVIEKWEIIKKNKIGSRAYLGLLLSQSEDNKYADVQLCNLLQSLDGFTQKLYKEFDKNKEKEEIIDKLIDDLSNYSTNNENLKENIKNALNNIKEYSFKERLEMLINECEYQELFNIEKNFSTYFDEKKNECEIFLKYNKLLRKSIDHRNYLSHMVDSDCEFNQFEIKLYYWKYLLLYRLSIIKLLKLERLLLIDNIKNNIKETLKWYRNNTNKCNNCKFYSDSKCNIINLGGNVDE